MACYVIILNYNGWKDTVECLESVLQSETEEKIKVIVCDNNSKDKSLENLMKWAEGRMYLPNVIRTPFKKDYADKILAYTYFDYPTVKKISTDLILMNNRENAGFAAGNNYGINLAISQKDCEYLFILNNDTVIDRKAIQNGINKLRENNNNGLCSTNVRYYADPKKNGWSNKRYCSWIGGEITPYSKLNRVLRNTVEKYSGMSFFVTRKFVETVGLMEEKYFLYYEEYDWAYRSSGKFKLVKADDSIVYHKEGASLNYISPFSQFCMMRSNFLFQRKFFSNKLFVVYIKWIIKMLLQILNLNFGISKQILFFLLHYPFIGEKYHYKYKEIMIRRNKFK